MEYMEIRNAEKGDEEILAWMQTESWKAAFSGILPENELEKATCFAKVKEMYRKILEQGICRTHLYSQHAGALGTWIRLTDDKRNFIKYEGRRICRSNAVGIWRK